MRCDDVHTAQPPNPTGACLGKVGKGAEWDRIAGEGARTIPGRENGGNCDIKNLTRGCKVPPPPPPAPVNTSLT